MLSAHYRSPLNFSADLMEASKNGLERILTAVDKLKELEGKAASGLMKDEESTQDLFLQVPRYGARHFPSYYI